MKLPNMILYGFVIVESEVGVYCNVLTVVLLLFRVSKQLLEIILTENISRNENEKYGKK